MSNKPKALVIMGPTASGKTALAVDMAKAHQGEIISVDSAMVYRGMDIGTAKPTVEEQGGIIHHLMDVCDPAEAYSAGRFLTDATALIKSILAKNKHPILVGGTMLYHYVLQFGVAQLPAANADMRAELDKKAKKIGWQAMHATLEKVDSISAKRIHPNDSQRIQRALEVYYLTGVTLHDWHQQEEQGYHDQLPCQFVNVALKPEPRITLHNKIALRFHQMIEDGFIDEVRVLFQRADIHIDLPAMRSVGYRQAWSYLQGDYDKATMIERAIVATRQLAKRQYTWLNKWPKAHCFAGDESDLLERVSCIY